MVEVTIKTDFAEDGTAYQKEHTMPPCGLAIVACISPGNEGEEYQSNGAAFGGEGMEMCKAADLLAEMTVKALKGMADAQEERQELIFAVFMEAFLREAPDMDVIDEEEEKV